MRANNIFGIEDEGKTAGLLSYFFIIGWSTAYFVFHKKEKTSLSSYHLRQTLMLYLSYVVVRYGLFLFLGSILHPSGIFSSFYLILLINLTFITFWVIGLVGASNGQKKPIPIFGQPAQFLFATV